MEDRIYKFLERNYVVSIEKYYVSSSSYNTSTDIFGTRYSIFSNLTNKLSLDKGIMELLKIFPEKYDTEEIFIKWYENKIKHLENKVLQFYMSNRRKSFIKILQLSETLDYPELTKEFIEDAINRIHYRLKIQTKIDSYFDSVMDNMSLIEMEKDIVSKFKTGPTRLSNVLIQHTRRIHKHHFFNVKLPRHFINMDFKKGSLGLIPELAKTFNEEISLYGQDMSKEFEKYYFNNYMSEKMQSYFNENIRDKNISSNQMLKNFKELELETPTYQGLCTDYLLAHYNEYCFHDKVQDLLSQLVIRLSDSNWEVVWVGHGKFSFDKMMEALDEHRCNSKNLLKYYNTWFNKAVELASYKEIWGSNPPDDDPPFDSSTLKLDRLR